MRGSYQLRRSFLFLKKYFWKFVFFFNGRKSHNAIMGNFFHLKKLFEIYIFFSLKKLEIYNDLYSVADDLSTITTVCIHMSLKVDSN